MIAADVRAFVVAALPPPARVLEIGAGEGDLARALTALGYDVLAIDPDPRGDNVHPLALQDVEGSFDAAVAIVSLHHVTPLDESVARLAAALAPGAPLVVDEIDVAAFDARAAEWWLAHQRARGVPHEHDAETMAADMRAHLHPLAQIARALRPAFAVGAPVRGPYLYRWRLNESLRAAEEELIAQGRLPAVGARLVAIRA